MKICLYSPYIPKHTGGGEKYLFDVASVLAEHHEVCIAISASDLANETDIRKRYELFLNRSLKNITFISSPIDSAVSSLEKLLWTKQFDVLYYLTDGSLFFSLAKKNILHIQFPLQLDKSGLVEQLKLKNWQVKNTNSEFTKRVVEKSWPVSINVVHHPMIDVEEIQRSAKTQPKENIILSVGRFFRQLHSKRQDVLVRMFANLDMADWKLVLIGGVEDEDYLAEIKNMAKGLNISILTNVSRQELLQWYARAAIFWHAAGYEVDEQEHPEKVEHFGISTVEAMAAGCVPLVHGKGGQVEVMGDELRDLLWSTEEECSDKTKQVIHKSKWRRELSEVAKARAATFGKDVFTKKLESMIEGAI